MRKAKKEYEKTADSLVEEEFRRVPVIEGNLAWDPQGNIGVDFYNMKQDILQNSGERLSKNSEYLKENMKETEVLMSEQDIREFNGIFNPKGSTAEEKINALRIQADHWRQKALLKVNTEKEKWYKDAEKLTRMEADKLSIDNDIRPEEETISLIQQEIEESDLTRFEKFKKWSKENLLGLSAVAILSLESSWQLP